VLTHARFKGIVRFYYKEDIQYYDNLYKNRAIPYYVELPNACITEPLGNSVGNGRAVSSCDSDRVS